MRRNSAHISMFSKRQYSAFWLAVARGEADLSIFAVNDAPELAEPAGDADLLDMAAWLRLPEQERAAIVATYAGSGRKRG